MKRTLSLVAIVFACVVVGLGSWQIVSLRSEVSALQTKHNAPTYATAAQLDTLRLRVNLIANDLMGLEPGRPFASKSDVTDLQNSVNEIHSAVSCLLSVQNSPGIACGGFPLTVP